MVIKKLVDTDEASDESVMLWRIFSTIYSEDVVFNILAYLCKKKQGSTREIARYVGISHKNLAKYLEILVEKGMVEIAYDKPNLRVYRLRDDISILKRFFMLSG
ncbi:MAG: ArsR family transcriptional regulator [Candidatus Nitrosocaldus sp.]|nr:ArsR family transcriptional regulator [Candidatus Nitrosocaldus sp.]MDW8000086.1 helix-turn-helix domain-containing protein [Candidatus Nitrosocaldus sp.]